MMERRAARLAVLGLVVAGCRPAEPEADTSRPSEFGFQKSIEATLIADGETAYATYCIGCHGATGDGRGEAAGFLDPKPRNFQLGEFKFSSREVGDLPTDDDLRRTITNGLRGSAMPAFRFLPQRTVDGLIAYVKTFSPTWEERRPGAVIPIVDDPWSGEEDQSEAIARGEAVYHGFATCWSCHPAYVTEAKLNEHLVQFGDERKEEFRPNLDKSVPKPNEQGDLLYPPDFRRDFVRSGSRVEDLYRSIGAGLAGSAMPTWIHSIEYAPQEGQPPITEKKDIWAMAYYVRDLIRQRPAKLTGAFEVRDRPRKLYPNGLPAEAPATDEEEVESQ